MLCKRYGSGPKRPRCFCSCRFLGHGTVVLSMSLGYFPWAPEAPWNAAAWASTSCKCSPPTSREFPVSVGEGSRLWPILNYQCDVTNWEEACAAGLGAVEASSSASGPQGTGVTTPAKCPLGPFRMHLFLRIWSFLVIQLLLNAVSMLYSLLLFDVLLIIGRQVRQSLILFS